MRKYPAQIEIVMVKSKIKLGEFKHYLEQSSKNDLIDEIVKLYSQFESVRDYYQTKLCPESEEQVVEKYKAIIRNEFFPSRGFGKLRLSEANKAISEYKNICRSKASLVDLMLFYVEMGVKFINEYGDIKESFYNSGESMYEKAIGLIVENNMQEIFKGRCQRIVKEASGTGYGFHDEISYMYKRYFKPEAHA